MYCRAVMWVTREGASDHGRSRRGRGCRLPAGEPGFRWEDLVELAPGCPDEGVWAYVTSCGLKIRPWLVLPFITTVRGVSKLK